MKELCLPTISCYGQPMAKADLRTLAVRLPEDTRIPMPLGLEGDCDFSRSLTDFFPHLCGKEELLTLIDSDPGPELRLVHGLPDYLMLCRRYAVWVCSLWSC